ncbi:MAG: hypothetical protein R3F53_08345 [Gammaproteobacteria bacterium]
MAQQTDVLTQLLATTQPFDSLPPEIRQDLQAQTEVHACPTGTVIIEAGQTNHYLRIVLSGQLSCASLMVPPLQPWVKAPCSAIAPC